MEKQWEQCNHFTDLMLQRRGYRFRMKDCEDDHLHIYDHETKPSLLLWYFRQEKMNIDSIKEFVYRLETSVLQHGIIVYQSAITSSTKKIIDNLFQFRIEIFEMRHLLYDIIAFRYYCPHELVPQEEALLLKKKFGHSFPGLLKTDPVVRYFGFNKGDIIKIFRQNDTIAYRIVR